MHFVVWLILVHVFHLCLSEWQTRIALIREPQCVAVPIITPHVTDDSESANICSLNPVCRWSLPSEASCLTPPAAGPPRLRLRGTPGHRTKVAFMGPRSSPACGFRQEGSETVFSQFSPLLSPACDWGGSAYFTGKAWVNIGRRWGLSLEASVGTAARLGGDRQEQRVGARLQRHWGAARGGSAGRGRGGSQPYGAQNLRPNWHSDSGWRRGGRAGIGASVWGLCGDADGCLKWRIWPPPRGLGNWVRITEWLRQVITGLFMLL